METINKMIWGCILLISFTINSFGQAPMVSIEEGGKMPAKIDKAKIPKVVTETYVVEYPMATYENWYGYPVFADESDWYGYNPYLVVDENPEYYIVEFNKEKTAHKVIYSKTGKKIAVHKKLNSNIPEAVSSALKKGGYKGWAIAKEKEEISGDSDKMKVYKVIVEKGTEKHILFYQSDGKLLKDKKIKS